MAAQSSSGAFMRAPPVDALVDTCPIDESAGGLFMR